MSKLSNKELQALRQEYLMEELDESHINPDPIQQFNYWLSEALQAEIPEPNAMVLSTVNLENRPTGRVVLLKGVESGNFIFFTNYESQKGKEMEQHPFAALTFNWLMLQRQIRIEGRIEKISPEDSTAYFQSRPKGSQIGAWASNQSSIIPSRQPLEEKVAKLQEEYKNADILPRPPHWGGYQLIPDKIEFWQGRASRLHDRFQFSKTQSTWTYYRLAP